MAQANRARGARAARRSRAVAPARRASRGRAKPKGVTVAAPSAEAPLCSVAFCPICTAVTAFGVARPELLEHVLVAGREMLLALRALIDARLEGSGEPTAKLERLTIE